MKDSLLRALDMLMWKDERFCASLYRLSLRLSLFIFGSEKGIVPDRCMDELR